MREIYLDHNATTRTARNVQDAMDEASREYFANPSSTHRAGQKAKARIEQARRDVAACLGCQPSDVRFTASGTESIFAAAIHLANARSERNHIVAGSADHPAVLAAVEKLESNGFEYTLVSPDSDGLLAPESLSEAITEQTALVSLTHVNSETGVIWDIGRLSRIAKSAGAMVHVDAVQSPGRLAIDMDKWLVDALSLSAHKFYGPKGIGILAMPGIPAPPPGTGTDRVSGGTENTPGIVGAAVALDTVQNADLSCVSEIRRLRDLLESRLLNILPDAVVIGKNAPRVCNTLCIASPIVNAETVLFALSERGIFASGGSACSSGSLEPSHVLKSMGLDNRTARGAMRFSLSNSTTEEEILECAGALATIIKSIVSP